MSTLQAIGPESFDDDFDPQPEAPDTPDDYACCHSGCQPCVWDIYDSAVSEYRQKLAAWQLREVARQARAANKGPDEQH
ncbi:oxidoreductase-like domain-containing protein [Vogesella sp. XCS3]|uniref:oxidoreductase-like domain-containing protein n=1 Tax=Vogesella sp. XCS3 TaxID=2877939 RepID=UPI001D0B8991|nr:oxidoreductase-like domain-containing protein [Vogesella sp. XCS3]UDM16966.1 oxidoreductase-like domain-containing protein [Vogesella sp. XCS3]